MLKQLDVHMQTKQNQTLETDIISFNKLTKMDDSKSKMQNYKTSRRKPRRRSYDFGYNFLGTGLKAWLMKEIVDMDFIKL